MFQALSAVALVLFLVAVTPAARADIITGTFTGTVFFSYGPGVLFGISDNDLSGLTVQGSFIYDPSLFQTVDTDHSTFNRTANPADTNSLIITEAINGVSITITNPINFSQFINVSQNMATTQYGPGNVVTGLGLASFGQSETFSLTYTALNSPTVITSNIANIGAIKFGNIVGETAAKEADTFYFGTAFAVQLDALRVHPVPEPSSGTLFASGLLALGLFVLKLSGISHRQSTTTATI